MIITQTPRLIIRNWEERDRDLFHEINSDAQVMEYFPFIRTRSQSDDMFDRIQSTIRETGFGFYALERRDDGHCIGFTGLARVDMQPIFAAGTVEIGWRLAPPYWGQGFVSEAANHLIKYGFDELKLAEIVSFAVSTNQRSIAVMQRIGMKHDAEDVFDHPRIGDDQAHLKRHVTYRIKADKRN